jgi:hypothetical protein
MSFTLMMLSRNLEITISSPEYTYKNGNYDITIGINNRTIIPLNNCNINYKCEIYEQNRLTEINSAVSVGVPPLSNQRVVLEQQHEKYIFMKISITNVVLHDILGIFHTKIKCKESSEISIIPNIYSDFLEVIPLKKHEADDEILIREFIPGDKMSHIHQKLSAKSEDIFTRYYQEEDNIPLLILDIATDDEFENSLELYVKTAYALISDMNSVKMINVGFDDCPTIVNDIKTLQKHLVNIVKDVNTKKYNEYISSFDSSNIPVVYHFPEDNSYM